MSARRKKVELKQGWDREGRTKALIEAAMDVFASKGFDAATTREIAAQAGCAEGLITRYFGSKHGLLMEALKSRAGQRPTSMDDELPIAGGLLEDLQQITEWVIADFAKRRDFMRVMIGRAIVDPKIGKAMWTVLQGKQKEIAARLHRHQELGRITGNIDLDNAARAVMALIFNAGFMGQVVYGESSDAVKATAAGFTRLFARAVGTSERKI